MKETRKWLLRLLLALGIAVGNGASAEETLPEYRLGAGDTIRIQVFQNPDLTLEGLQLIWQRNRS